MPERLMTTTEVAKVFGVHPSTILRWEREGVLRSIRIAPGAHPKFKASVVEAILNTQERNE